MKAMWNIFRIFALSAVLFAASACQGEYNPLPPKTDSSVQYALPYYEKPDLVEIDAVMEARKEYENATK